MISATDIQPRIHRTLRARLYLCVAALAFSCLLKGCTSESAITLPPHQRELLLHEVNFFADRYFPALPYSDRARIVDDIQLAGDHELQSAARTMAILGGAALAVALGAAFWGLLNRARLRHLWDFPPNRGLIVVGCMLILVLVLSGAYGLRHSWKIDSQTRGAEIGGDVSEGKIHLTASTLASADDELIGTFDHELVHLFGSARYQKIRRDAWLAYAYELVLEMSRGGTKGVWRATQIRGDSKDIGMYFFYKGVHDAALAPVGDNAENELMTTVKQIIGPIDPDAPTDNLILPTYEANWSYASGLAGIAWTTGNGDLNSALKYLDDRGNGLTPAETVADVKHLADFRQKIWQDEQQPLLSEAILFLNKVGLRQR